MKTKISIYCVKKLIEDKVILESEKDLYLYGLEEMITILLNFCLTVFAGIICKQVGATLVFLLSYILLRSYAGGYHAATEKQCFVYSIILIIFCEVIFKYFHCIPLNFIWSFFILSIIILIFFAPVSAENKPLLDGEYENCRYKLKIIIVILVIITYLLYFNQFTSWYK